MVRNSDYMHIIKVLSKPLCADFRMRIEGFGVRHNWHTVGFGVS